MASVAGSIHYVPFYIGIIGLVLSDFVIDYFNRDGLSVDLATASSFNVVELGNGYYTGQYTPTFPGFYFLALSNTSNSVRVVEGIDIDTAIAAVDLTQDYGGTSNLKPLIINPQYYVLLIYKSSDWKVGRTTVDYSVACTLLDTSGNWLTTPLTVSPDTYNLALRNNDGEIIVFKVDLVAK